MCQEQGAQPQTFSVISQQLGNKTPAEVSGGGNAWQGQGATSGRGAKGVRRSEPQRFRVFLLVRWPQLPAAAVCAGRLQWKDQQQPASPFSLQVSHRFRELMQLFHTACEGSSEDEDDATSTSNADQLSDHGDLLSEEELDE